MKNKTTGLCTREKYSKEVMNGFSYREIFKAVLPRSIAMKAIFNLDMENADWNGYDSFDPWIATAANDPLSSSFHWNNTPEGGEYWIDVKHKYFSNE